MLEDLVLEDQPRHSSLHRCPRTRLRCILKGRERETNPVYACHKMLQNAKIKQTYVLYVWTCSVHTVCFCFLFNKG